MSVNKIAPAAALGAGADLWVIQNNPELTWWKQLDLHSRYLLSQNFLRKKTEPPAALREILQATALQVALPPPAPSYLLLGTADHFFNKWLLVWNHLSANEAAALVEKTAQGLQSASVRFFSDSDVAQLVATGPRASSLTISYIENI